jgi:hypothetical protein
MKAKNLVYWCGLLVLLLGAVLAAAGAGSATQAQALATNQVAALSPAGGLDQARICIDLMCPDGTPRDEFCRCRPRACITQMCPDGSPRDEFCQCPISTSSNSKPAQAVGAAPGTAPADKVLSFWPVDVDVYPGPCPDVMCPDGSLPDEYCRCQPRACIDLMCPDGSPRDKFCRCPISTNS